MRYNENVAALGELRRAILERQKENTARTAKSRVYWTTTGSGEFVVDTAMRFDCVFVEKPHFTYGVELPDDQDLIKGKYPRTHAGVYNWVREHPPGNVTGDPDDAPEDDLLYYTGAYIYFVVDFIGNGATFTLPQPKYTLIHHMAFEGMAIKNVPVTHLLEKA